LQTTYVIEELRPPKCLNFAYLFFSQP